MMQWYQARESFTIELGGAPVSVGKGRALPENDPIVRHDLKHGGKLFALLDSGEPPEPKPKTAVSRAAAKVTGKAP
jgi:hypothetical protein